MAFKILITEAESPLALSLLHMFEDREHNIICPEFTADDWADPQKVTSLLTDVRPAIFINTLQFSFPESSELNPLVYQSVAEQCAEHRLSVIHLSSHEVFSASQQKGKPMKEDCAPEPDTVTGRMYLGAELAFAQNPNTLTLRLPWILDCPGGVLESTLHQLVYDQTIQSSQNWHGTFVCLSEVSRVVGAVAEQILCDSNNWGAVHIHSSDSCSELEFVDYLQRLLEKSGGPASAEVNVVSNEYRMIQTNGWLVGSRCTNNFGIQFRSWRYGIKSKVEYWLNREVAEKGLVVKPQTVSG